MISQPEPLALNLIVFGRILRRFGLGAQPDRIVLFAQALDQGGFASRDDVKAAGRSVFVRNADERRRFDAAFDAFWSAAMISRAPDDRAAKPPDGAPAPADEPHTTRPHIPDRSHASIRIGAPADAAGAPAHATLVP